MISPPSTSLHLPVLFVIDGCSTVATPWQQLAPIIQTLSLACDPHKSLEVLIVDQQGTTNPEAQIRSQLASYLPTNIHHIHRRPVKEILSTVQATQAGLVVTACRDRRGIDLSLRNENLIKPNSIFLNPLRSNGFKKIELGFIKSTILSRMSTTLKVSISQGIARYAPCAVLLLREQERPTFTPWEHVLLVINGTEASRQAIAITRQLIPAGIRRITLLWIQPPVNTRYLFGPFATPTPTWQLNQLLQQAWRDQSQQVMNRVQGMFQCLDLQVQTLIHTGDPGSLICQVAQQCQVDGIILGSDAPRYLSLASYPKAFQPIRLTATADYVIHHAPCSVLLCRMVAQNTSPRLMQGEPSQRTERTLGFHSEIIYTLNGLKPNL